MKPGSNYERTPEQRPKDNLHILATILREQDRVEWLLKTCMEAKERILTTYLYDCDLTNFYKEYDEFKSCDEKSKAFRTKYLVYDPK